MSRTPVVGSLEWERAGGPPLTFAQKLSQLGGAAVVLASHFSQKWWWQLGLPRRAPRQLGEEVFAPPDSRTARRAEEQLRAVSSPQMVNHSLRVYAFAMLLHELDGARVSLDREALYVAALLHDVGLFDAVPAAGEHCFTVSCARVARRVTGEDGWTEARRDRVAPAHVKRETVARPSCRFAALEPIFPMMVRSARFRSERGP